MSSPHSSGKAALILFRAHGIQRSRWLERGGVLTLSGTHLKLAEEDGEPAGSRELRVLIPSGESWPLGGEWLRVGARLQLSCPYHNNRGALLLIRGGAEALSRPWNPHGVALSAAGEAFVSELASDGELTVTRLIDPYELKRRAEAAG